VTCDIVTRTIGHPWLWLQEVTSNAVHLCDFHRCCGRHPRNDHLYLTAISDALHGTPRLIVEIVIRLVVLGVACCLIWFGYINFLRVLGASGCPRDADRFALCRDPVRRPADCAVHDRAAGHGIKQRI